MSKRLRPLLGLALLGLLVWRTDWARVAESFARLNWGLWLAAVGAFLGAQLVSSVRWRMMARPLGFGGPTGRYVALYFVGMFFNLVLPTSVGGDFVRAWYLARSDQAPNLPGRGMAALGSVLMERLSGLMLLLSLACVAVCFCPAEVAAWLPWTVWGLAAAAVVGLAALIALPRAPTPLRYFPKLNARVTRLSRQLADAISVVLREPRLLLTTTLLSLVVQAANVVVVWLIGVGLGADVPAGYYWVLVPLVSLLTMLPVSINGMGLREWAAVALLAPLGVADGVAVSLAFLWFLAQAAVSLSGVAFYAGGGFARPPAGGLTEEETEHGPVGDRADQGREGQPPAAA